MRAGPIPLLFTVWLAGGCAAKAPIAGAPAVDPPPSASSTDQAATDVAAHPFARAVRPGDCVRDDSFGPVHFDASREWERRRFTSSLQNYAESPYVIETCGVRAHYEILQYLTCPDGRRPITPDNAFEARIGQTTAMPSRCGTIVDAYTVPCTSGDITVYMDGYYCTDGESFR